MQNIILDNYIIFEGKNFKVNENFFKKVVIEEIAEILSEIYYPKFNKILSENKDIRLEAKFLDTIKGIGSRFLKGIGKIWNSVKKKLNIGGIESKYEDFIDDSYTNNLVNKFVQFRMGGYSRQYATTNLIDYLINKERMAPKDAEDYARAISLAAKKVMDTSKDSETSTEKGKQDSKASEFGIRGNEKNDVTQFLGRQVDRIASRELGGSAPASDKPTSAPEVSKTTAADQGSYDVDISDAYDDAEELSDTDLQGVPNFWLELEKTLMQIRPSNEEEARELKQVKNKITKTILSKVDADTDPRRLVIYENKELSNKLIRVKISRIIGDSKLSKETKEKINTAISSWMSQNQINSAMFKAFTVKRGKGEKSDIFFDRDALADFYKKSEKAIFKATEIDKQNDDETQEVIDTVKKVYSASQEIDPDTGQIRPESLESLKSELERVKDLKQKIKDEQTKSALSGIESGLQNLIDKLSKTFSKKQSSDSKPDEAPSQIAESLFVKRGNLFILKA